MNKVHLKKKNNHALIDAGAKYRCVEVNVRKHQLDFKEWFGRETVLCLEVAGNIRCCMS